ncbi:MAG: hypothetical protein GWM92_14515 [Gemmatimonadetes bacterium]|nr:hypothetical protein [Gemmatimonadota bacterium]NIR79955.1 hypothetical protein [Gemmatimonadota bacterium]NIT88680.1 hypothetical protein [Gemmatimonadota bacterium]NIU32491.1 hypothetical protein [Gemmatimonadota bacterium]NIU36972.1 hypothetical protein [Gemmatimonadota bacterium]
MVTRIFRVTAAVVLLLVLSTEWTGCARRSPFDEGGRREAPIRLEVENHNYLDVVVLAMPDGIWRRLGTVTGVSTTNLEVPGTIASRAGGFRLLVDPVGSQAAYLTEPIYASPGDTVVLQVGSVIRMSSWYLR